MDIIRSLNNKTYNVSPLTKRVCVSTDVIFTSNEQNNIMIFEQLCDAYFNFKKSNNNYKSLILDSHKKLIIINEKKLYCKKEYFKYIVNVIKKYPQITYMELTPHKDINNELQKLLLSSPNIKGYDFDTGDDQGNYQVYYDFNWKNTYVRHIEMTENSAEITFVEWLEQNPQIYSIHNNNSDTDKLILKMLKNNPNHSLMHMNISNTLTDSDLHDILFSKRKTARHIINIMLLISNHQHKFKKYLPKYITKMILEYIYDIDYIKKHMVSYIF